MPELRARDADPRRTPREPLAPRRTPPLRWGSLPGGYGVGIAGGMAMAGAMVTVLAGSEPGYLLGGFVIAGTAAAVFAVARPAAYLIIPVPALSCALAAMAAGLVHDRALDTSRTALAVGAARWIASGFLAMTASTALAIGIPVTRWWIARRWPSRESAR